MTLRHIVHTHFGSTVGSLDAKPPRFRRLFPLRREDGRDWLLPEEKDEGVWLDDGWWCWLVRCWCVGVMPSLNSLKTLFEPALECRRWWRPAAADGVDSAVRVPTLWARWVWYTPVTSS